MGGTPKYLTASAVVAARPATVGSVVVGVAAAAQTVKLHNCLAVVDAAPGNLVATLSLAAAQTYVLDALFTVGVVAVVSGGTPEITVVTD